VSSTTALVRSTLMAAGAAAAVATSAAPAAAAATSGRATTLTASGAMAAPGPLRGQTLGNIQQRAAAAIAARQAALTGLASVVSGAADLSAGDRSALSSLVAGDQSGLAALGQTIAADTTPPAAWQDAQRIVTGYRVYVLAVPQVHLVRAADIVGSVGGRLAGLGPTLEQMIAQAPLSAGQRATATAALSELTSEADDATAAVASVSSVVLGLSPAGYPANRAQLQTSLAAVVQARGDLASARHDVDVIERLVLRG
jgi:hypothetical protein